MLTVGDPVTTISNNHFKSTPVPEVSNGEAVVENNKVTE
jgi:hypothetical protein